MLSLDLLLNSCSSSSRPQKKTHQRRQFCTVHGPVIPKNGVLAPYRDRTTVCWNTPLPEPAVPVRYYRKCPVSSSYRPVIPPGNTDRDDRPATVRHDRPVLPSSPGQRSKKRPKVQGTEKIGEQKTLPDSEYQVREARTSNMLRNGGFPGGAPREPGGSPR